MSPRLGKPAATCCHSGGGSKPKNPKPNNTHTSPALNSAALLLTCCCPPMLLLLLLQPSLLQCLYSCSRRRHEPHWHGFSLLPSASPAAAPVAVAVAAAAAAAGLSLKSPVSGCTCSLCVLFSGVYVHLGKICSAASTAFISSGRALEKKGCVAAAGTAAKRRSTLL